MDISTSEITSRKVHGNGLDFSTNEITLKKVRAKRQKNDFLINEIALKKVRRNEVHRKITWKR